MYIRCQHCHVCTRLPMGNGQTGLHCYDCGRRLDLQRIQDLGATPHDRFKNAFEYSRTEKLDLGSAYSVLLGIMALEKAVTLRLRGGEDAWSHSKNGYDRAYRAAVKEGFLTVARARARGDRVVYATRVAHEHDLSLHQAFLLADNRVSLAQAKQGLEASGRASVPAAKEDAPRSYVTAMALVLAAVGAFFVADLLVGVREVTEDPGEVAVRAKPRGGAASKGFAAVQASAEIRVDAQGQLTHIVGSTPRSILDAYCGAAPGATEPVRVIPSGAGWTGVFRRGDRYGSIEIQREPGDVWSAGDGTSPIVTRPAAADSRTYQASKP